MKNPEFRFFDYRITFETAKGKRRCKQIGCLGGYDIYPGDQHLAIYNVTGIRTNYCLMCAPQRMKQLEDQVNDAAAAIDAATDMLNRMVS